MLYRQRVKKQSPAVRLEQALHKAYEKAVMTYLTQDYHYDYDYILDRFTKKYRKMDVSNIDYDMLFDEFEELLRNQITVTDVLSYLKKDFLKDMNKQEIKALKGYIQNNIINKPKEVMDKDYFADLVLLTICCDPY
jgi:hypothetical protein